ncbi:hypothetical protein QTN25_009734 [Entamoeba marina]
MYQPQDEDEFTDMDYNTLQLYDEQFQQLIEDAKTKNSDYRIWFTEMDDILRNDITEIKEVEDILNELKTQYHHCEEEVNELNIQFQQMNEVNLKLPYNKSINVLNTIKQFIPLLEKECGCSPKEVIFPHYPNRDLSKHLANTHDTFYIIITTKNEILGWFDKTTMPRRVTEHELILFELVGDMMYPVFERVRSELTIKCNKVVIKNFLTIAGNELRIEPGKFRNIQNDPRIYTFEVFKSTTN